MSMKWIAWIVTATVSLASGQTFIWWEGEDAAETSFPLRSSFSPANDDEAAVLSGGRWLSIDGQYEQTPHAEYDVVVDSAGTYDLWVRKFWRHGPFRWRFNDGPWHGVGREVVLADGVTMRHLVQANWVRLAPVELAEGTHRFRIEVTAESGAAAFDCFMLIQGPFVPRGRLRPGESFGQAPEGWFAFEPPHDPLTQTPLDLRFLNERFAGEHGWIVRRGADLVAENQGEAIRFWGVTATHNVWRMDRRDIDYLARRLAKMGVNMIRIHAAPFYELQPGRDTDGIQYFTAAMKEQGIYVGISWYCLAGARVQPGWNLPELPDGYRPMGAMFCYEPLQEVYKQWGRTLLSSPNPYTGIPLGQDPAVAFVELIDEDNYFFWTFRPEQMPEPILASLQTAFGDWLVARYGSLEAARAAWGDGPTPQGNADDWSAGRVALYNAGQLTGQAWAAAARDEARASDQLRFLTEHQRAFWASMRQWLREEIGFGGVVVATNWQTADERVLGPLDKYTYLATDATARNCYFVGPVQAERGHTFSVGDHYQDLSVLRAPQSAVMMEMQYADYPHLLTEGGWAMPNRFRAEGPVLSAVYGALQGTDGFLPFVLEPNWTGMIAKWPIQTPVTFGQYPAAALIYRLGYVAEGPVAVHERLDLESLYRFEGAAMMQAMGIDDVRLHELPDGRQAEIETLTGLDPLAFYVGRVIRTIAENPGRTTVLANLAELIDRPGQTVHSATGELTLDYGTGLLRIDAPRAQGVTGFLAQAGPVDLADVTIHGRNEYASVLLVSLDGEPLARSGRMLLQVMSEEQNLGWQTTEVEQTDRQGNLGRMQRIESLGEPPILVRDFDATVTLRRPDTGSLTVTALDINGYSRQGMPAGTAGELTVELLPDCLYYLIER